MPAEYITTDQAPAALPGIYSQAVRAGPFLYCSGSVGMSKDGKMIDGTLQDRTRQIIQNLQAVLKASGMDLQNVVKANVYLSNLPRDFNTFNEVWAELMPTPKPARTCIGVKDLPAGGTDVEIEFTAYDG